MISKPTWNPVIKEIMPHEVIMNIRKYQNIDKNSLINLWKDVFPEDPPHNNPSIVIEQKLAIDDLIFVAEDNKVLAHA